MMEKRYIVSPVNACVCGGTALILMCMAIDCFVDHVYIAGLLLAALGVVFVVTCLNYGAVIGLYSDRVEKKVLFGKQKTVARTDIKEVGVVGLRMYRKNAHNHGTRYIYFSEAELTEQERFNLCLSWPPKNMVYLEWTTKRMSEIQSTWACEVEQYNAGDIGL